MPTDQILALLVAERDRLNKAIEALSREMVWKSADRSPAGRTFMPPEAGNGPRKPNRSPPLEPISAAGCCLETLGAASVPAPGTLRRLPSGC
jgi:hypothetical protein